MDTAQHMDPGMAEQLFANGAVLVIAGIPIGTEFGIDLCSHIIGEQFRGIKMIPPGPHYVWCASRGPYGDTAPRVGFVYYFHAGEVVVREWDAPNEELRERRIAEPELEKCHIKENLRELDRFLAPYDYRYAGEWKFLTDTITEATVARCRPSLGTIRTNVELQSCPDAERPRGPAKSINPQNASLVTDENDLLPQLKPIEGTAPRFTTLPERVPRNATPAEISLACMDCHAAVDTLMLNFSTSESLIEEVQLAFAFFLVGHSIESLAQWRKLLALLAHSQAAVPKYRLLYMKYSEVLAVQLPRLPEELLEPSEHNTVYKDVRSLLVNLSVAGLAASAERLGQKLLKDMRWQFEGLMDDDPEDMPVVVEAVEGGVAAVEGDE